MCLTEKDSKYRGWHFVGNGTDGKKWLEGYIDGSGNNTYRDKWLHVRISIEKSVVQSLSYFLEQYVYENVVQSHTLLTRSLFAMMENAPMCTLNANTVCFAKYLQCPCHLQILDYSNLKSPMFLQIWLTPSTTATPYPENVDLASNCMLPYNHAECNKTCSLAGSRNDSQAKEKGLRRMIGCHDRTSTGSRGNGLVF